MGIFERKEERFTEERALFGASGVRVTDCTFDVGESPLKHATDIEVAGGAFYGKYPLWYTGRVNVCGTGFGVGARAGVWYSDQVHFQKCRVDAPKLFRRCSGVLLEEVEFTDSPETLWDCSDVRLSSVTCRGDFFGAGCRNVVSRGLKVTGDQTFRGASGLSLEDTEAEGNYFGMNLSGAEIDGLNLTGKYCFDGCTDLTIRNSRIFSRDCIWNCRNVVIRDSCIHGAYLAWNSEHVLLENCEIESLQGLCYVRDLTIRNCRLKGTSLAFEYSEVDARITGEIDSVMNPKGGRIIADRIGKLIMDPGEVEVSATVIEAEVGERLERFDGVIPEHGVIPE